MKYTNYHTKKRPYQYIISLFNRNTEHSYVFMQLLKNIFFTIQIVYLRYRTTQS
jgi:hypothetical protein